MNNLSNQLIFIELNEINFDLVKCYLLKFPGCFPGLEKLLACKNIHTTSEEMYEELEPWIQWTSAHTGKSYSDHKVFRLGDAVGSNVPQYLEQLEMAGLYVGGICPMNTENRLKNAAYFIPDPWTKTHSDNSWWSRQLHTAIAQIVNDNAQSKITKKSAAYFALGIIWFAKCKHYVLYLKLALRSIGSPWRRALFLDLFLHDLHTSYFKHRKPQFSTLFLNAGAHIQHHYLHSSPFISAESGFRNPNWYISSKVDPFAEMLEVYDCIIEDYLAAKDYELIIATGLSQLPFDRIQYYYRLKDHAAFLRSIGINFLEIHPRMTRDFLIIFASIDDALKAQKVLSGLTMSKKTEPLFGEIENRGDKLFVTLTYPEEILVSDVIKFGSTNICIFKEVAFVAIKNGMHQSKGFAFFTSDIAEFCPENGSHVKELYHTVINFFDVEVKSFTCSLSSKNIE
jgi:hypothetical protein